MKYKGFVGEHDKRMAMCLTDDEKMASHVLDKPIPFHLNDERMGYYDGVVGKVRVSVDAEIYRTDTMRIADTLLIAHQFATLDRRPENKDKDALTVWLPPNSANTKPYTFVKDFLGTIVVEQGDFNER